LEQSTDAVHATAPQKAVGKPGRGHGSHHERRHRPRDCKPGGAPGSGGRAGTGGASGSGGFGDNGGAPDELSTCVPMTAQLLDDLEDGDIFLSSTPGGVWFNANDETGTQSPNPFTASANPGNGSKYAACTHGNGFSGWGALIGLSFSPSSDLADAACLDVTGLTGIRFKARGSSSGSVNLFVPMRSSTSVEFGGTCVSDVCDWNPAAPIPLTEDWRTYSIPFSALSGGQQPFDPAELFQIEFQADDTVYPTVNPISFDFCVDDVSFY